MGTLKLPDGISPFRAVQYDKVARELLNAADATSSGTGASETTKTPPFNASGVTFQYIRGQSNLIIAILAWVGGHIARMFIPNEPLNDNQAKSYLLPYVAFLVNFNEDITIRAVNTKLEQFEKTKTAAQKDFDSQVKELNDLVGKYNAGKNEDVELAKFESADKINEFVKKLLELKPSQKAAETVPQIEKQLEAVRTAWQSREDVGLVASELRKACGKSAEAAHDRNRAKTLNGVLLELRKVDPAIAHLPESGKKFNAESVKTFDAGDALAKFKASKQIGDGSGDNNGKLVYVDGAQKDKIISKKDRALVEALTEAQKGYAASTVESSQEKRIGECNTKLEALKTAANGKAKDDIGFAVDKLPEKVDGKNLESTLKSLEAIEKAFHKTTGIGADGKYAKVVGEKKVGDQADETLANINTALNAAKKQVERTLHLKKLLGESPTTDASLDALRARNKDIQDKHTKTEPKPEPENKNKSGSETD
jgi:hypothetical protein